MEGVNHNERAHALLSASGAKRWLNCTPAPRLEEKFGGADKSTSYAQEGTVAHELAELYLRYELLGNMSEEEFNNELDKIMSDELFNEEMLDIVPIYVDYCAQEYRTAKAQNNRAITFAVEDKLNLSAIIPDSFGTADCIIAADGTLEVIDLKYGKGVPVYAEWNPQLMLYALGALSLYDILYNIQAVKLTIVQPRLDNISSWEISVKDLRDWAITEVKPKAQQAFSGEGVLNSGSWCQFCKVRNRCRKLYEESLEMAKYEFNKPELLTDEEIAEVISKQNKISDWMASVRAYAQAEAEKGKNWPGFKLVEGVSRRKWADEDKVIETIFAECPELSEDEILTTKLNSITAIEKLMGKRRFATVLNNLVTKATGKPVLVPVNDKRPALGAEQAKIDFSD